MYGVTITELIKKMKMKNVLPEIDTDKVVLSHPDVNRPALQLTGFFDHFDRERVRSSAMWSRLISILFRGGAGRAL